VPEADALLEGLTDEQRDAVTTAANPLCIVAGAGSGKTRVLTRRIAWHSTEGGIDPRRVLALTFTRRAAAELRARTRKLGLREEVAAGTFHAAALAILRRFWDHTGRSHPTLLDRRMAFLARAHPKLDRAAVADLDAEIGWARARLVTPEAYGDASDAARRRPPKSAAFVSKAYADYQDAKRERRLIDFDDVLALCHATMQRETSFADAQRWRSRHLFVDEFQDVNPLQFAVLEAMRGPESTLVVVGDPDQAIYGWNGADPRFINDIHEHLPGVAVVHLRTNFRSTPEVLAAAGRVLDEEPQPAARFRGDPPTVTTTDLDDEPVTVARAVRARRKPGAPWFHQAVLARTNGQLPAIRAALEAAGIPTRSRGEGALLRRPEIMDLVERWPGGGSLSGAMADEADHDGPQLDPERAAMVEAFFQLGRDHLVLEPDATVDEFVSALRFDDRIGAAGDAVELSTFHAAKGLEWPIVHLVGLEDGLVPVAFARTVAARAEEQRLLYVAATRAERELHVTWSSARTIGSTVHKRAPSPWLGAFLTDDDGTTIEPDVDVLRSHITDHRPDIDLTDLVTPVSDSLAEWRAQAANQAKVAPTAVLSDEAMQRIAEQRPSTLDELAAVPGVGAGKARRFGPRLLEISAPLD
jgi:DNA helicase-2/ATP-dependent DNA helicase PcrA